MLLKDFIASARQSLLRLYPEEEAKALVSALCSTLPGVTSVTHILEPEFAVPSGSVPWLELALDRLLAGEPLQYVLGEAWFCGRRFKVSPSVLIPRPETEEMTTMAVHKARTIMPVPERPGSPEESRPFRIVDLCTGSGCIAWTMALELPEAQVLGVDISGSALEVASSQSFVEDSRSGISPVAERQPGEEARPEFIKADVLDTEELGRLGSFDVILSNPPYVRDCEKALMKSGVLEWEPSLALFVPDDDALRFYRAEAEFAAKSLRPGGFGIFEINEALGEETAALLRDSGLDDVEILDDFRGRTRFASFRRRG